MVGSRSVKATKYSYAERVLGAYTTAQKEHRRHAVHMATLRAQVKKTAQARQDKLGPQWTNWVSKAVHKLEDEGIFAPSEPSGNLTLTPAGKKAIAVARQSLSIPPHATPTPAEEDQIWKQVTQPSSTISRGTKRARRSSALPSSGRRNAEVSHILSTRAKRPRISTTSEAQVKNSPSKMTNAELVAKLQATQKAYEDALWRATSPLTDLDEDDGEEIARLKDQLKQREDEISQMHRALAEARRPTHGTETDDDTSPRREIHAASLAPRTLHGVTRTQSGSFISTLSKRPTPEPSTPGPVDHHLFDDYMTDGHFEREGNFAMQEDDHGPAYSLATPGESPVIATAVMPGQDTQSTVHKVTELEHSLAARVLDVKKLEDQLLELRTECSTAVHILSESNARITALQAELLAAEKQASELRAIKNGIEAHLTSSVEERDRTIQERDASIFTLALEKEKHLTQLADLQKTLSQAETTIASHVLQASITKNEVEALRSAVEAAEVSNVSLVDKQNATNSELQAYVARISELEQRNVELQVYKDTTTETLAAMSAENTSATERLQTAEARNEYISRQLSGIADEKTTLELALATSKNELLQRNEAIENLSGSLVRTQEEAASLRDEVDAMKLRISTLDKDLGTSEQTAQGLTAQLAASEEGRADLGVQLERSKKTIEHLNSSTEETKTRLSAVESAAEEFEKEAKMRGVEAQGLRSELAEAQRKASTAAEQLSAAQASHAQESSTQLLMILELEEGLETSRAELQSQLQSLTETMHSLQAARKRSAELEENLSNAMGRLQEAEEELSDMKESKEADEQTIHNLKEMFSALRDTQMRSLAELNNKVVSAHFSPAPKRRSARNAGKT